MALIMVEWETLDPFKSILSYTDFFVAIIVVVAWLVQNTNEVFFGGTIEINFILAHFGLQSIHKFITK